MSYTIDERETSLVFEESTGKWLCYTTVRKHITKVMKIVKDEDIIFTEEEQGRIIAIKFYLDERNVLLRSIPAKRTLSEEHLKALHNKEEKK